MAHESHWSWGEEAETAAVSLAAGSSTTTIFTPGTGRRFAVFFLFLQNTDGSNDATVTFVSDATSISGVLTLKALDASGIPDASILRIGNQGHPILVGQRSGDAFKVTKTGNGTVRGWAVVGRTH